MQGQGQFSGLRVPCACGFTSSSMVQPNTGPSSWRRFRLKLLLVAGLAIASLAAGYLHLSASRPVSSGPAGPIVDVAGFERAWTTRPVVFVGFGDSVTAGFGARRGYSYFDRLHKNPSDEFPEIRGAALSAVFPNLTVTNLAISGSRSHEVVGGQVPLLPISGREALGWVVITTGATTLFITMARRPHAIRQ
jgi:hypothetical protein